MSHYFFALLHLHCKFKLQEMRSTSYGGDGLPAGGQMRYAVIARKRLLSMV